MLGGRALAVDSESDPALSFVNKASRNPVIIRGQLELGRTYAQQALHRLRTAASSETPETLDQTIHASYKQLALGTSGVKMKLRAGTDAKIANPVLAMAALELDKAMVHIRNARHSAYSFSPERPNVVQQVIYHLEATISIVEQVMDLIG